MSFGGLNYFAVILAAVASFAFGGVWYNVWAEPWMAATGKSPDDLQAENTYAPYLVAFAAQLVMAWILAGLIGHLGAGQVNLKNGLISALFVWAGFVAAPLVVNHTFQGAPRALTLIDGGYWLGVLIVQGAIIGAMGAS